MEGKESSIRIQDGGKLGFRGGFVNRKNYFGGVVLPLLIKESFGATALGGISPASNCFNRRKRAAASRIRMNSMQKACTSINNS